MYIVVGSGGLGCRSASTREKLGLTLRGQSLSDLACHSCSMIERRPVSAARKKEQPYAPVPDLVR